MKQISLLRVPRDVPGAEITSSKRFAKPCSASASGDAGDVSDVGGTKAARSVAKCCKAYLKAHIGVSK